MRLTRESVLRAIRAALSRHEARADRYFGLALVNDVLGWLLLCDERGRDNPDAPAIRRDIAALVGMLDPSHVTDDYVASQLALAFLHDRLCAPPAPLIVEARASGRATSRGSATASVTVTVPPSSGSVAPPIVGDPGHPAVAIQTSVASARLATIGVGAVFTAATHRAFDGFATVVKTAAQLPDIRVPEMPSPAVLDVARIIEEGNASISRTVREVDRAWRADIANTLRQAQEAFSAHLRYGIAPWNLAGWNHSGWPVGGTF